MGAPDSPSSITADLDQGYIPYASQRSEARSMPSIDGPPMPQPYQSSSIPSDRPGGAGAAQEVLDNSTLISSFNTALTGLYEPGLDYQSPPDRTLSPTETISSIISSLSRNEETMDPYPYQIQTGSIEDRDSASHTNLDSLVD